MIAPNPAPLPPGVSAARRCPASNFPRARRQRLNPDERRQQIFVCAQKLFNERPYEDVSATDIAAAAGVARGLINHYFGNKRNLYLEVIRISSTVSAVAVAALPEGPPEERIDAGRGLVPGFAGDSRGHHGWRWGPGAWAATLTWKRS